MVGSVLGTRVVRKEDPKFITTGGVYLDDLRDVPELAGTAYVAYVRSTIAHGNVTAIDTSDATAIDGVDGWNKLSAQPFDLLVSDVDMPRMNGIDLVRTVKTDPLLKEMPVMIVSYKDREEDRLRGLEAGANYYLTKGSFHDESLLAAVRDLIGGP